MKDRGRGGCTCGEEEDGHGAVVLPLGPAAQRDQSHQEGQQGGAGPGAQQHQGGDLPVCRRRERETQGDTLVRHQLDSVNTYKRESESECC